MSGSTANLDINVDVKKVKEAIAALEKLATVSAKVEAKAKSLQDTVKKGEGSDKQATKDAKALANLERNLERGVRRYEELQRAVNKAGVGDKLRLDMQTRLNKALTEHNKALTRQHRVLSDAASSQKQISDATRNAASAVRQYENNLKGLGEGLKSTINLEKQRNRELEKSSKEQARILQDKQKYIRSEADFENRQREKSLADRYRFMRTEADAENKQREKLSADKYRYLRTDADAENRQRAQKAAKAYAYMRAEADAENKAYDARIRRAAANEIKLQREIEIARTRTSGVRLRADRQLPVDQARPIQNQANEALQAFERALRISGVGTSGAAAASGQFQRTMQGLSSEIARVNGMLPTLNRNARAISASFGAANASLGGFSRLVFSTSAALSSLAGALAIREVVRASMEFDRFSNTLRTVSGDTTEYTKNLNYLFAEGDRVGFNIGEVGNAFARMSVAMKGAGFSTDQTREAFTNLTEAARNFGLSSADTMGVIRALEQSLSKGKFMAEEVRLQMGDRLPIAMAALSAALTKVDGKVSNVSDRFEAGSIDVQRYALEFTKQINAMSGGAAALERTSNTVAAAFGRLGNELQRSLMVFKEEGFDAAIINITKSLTELLAAAREYGVVTLLAQAIEGLSKNLDWLMVVLAAFAASWTGRILASLVLAAKNFNMATLAIRGLMAALAGMTLYMFNLGKSPAQFAEEFNISAERVEKSLDKVKRKTDEVNASIQHGFATTASSADSDFEKLQKAYEKMGHTATQAIALSLRAQAENTKLEIDNIKKEIETAEKEIAAFYKSIQGNIRLSLEANKGDAYGGPLEKFSEQLLEILDKAVAAKKPLGEIVAEIEKLRDNTLVPGSTPTFISQVTVQTEELLAKLKDPENNKVMAPILEGFDLLLRKMGLAIALYNRLRASADEAASGIIFNPGASGAGGGEAGIVDGKPSYTPSVVHDYSRYEKGARDAAKATQFLQEALRGTNIIAATAQNFILKDAAAVRAEVQRLEAVAAGTGAQANGAREILKRYKEILKGSETQQKSSKRTLVDYMVEMQGHITQNKRIVAAYEESSEAGRLYEDTVEAIREVEKYMKPMYDENGEAMGKFAEAVKLTMERKKELSQTERDIAASRSVNNREIENEMALLKKEAELMGENIHLREEELEVLKKRQELTKDGPVSEEILKRAEEQVRQLVRMRRETKYLADSYEAVARIAENAFDQVADSITDAFARGEISALRFGDIIRGVMASVISQFLKLGLINPVLNALMPTSDIRPTLFASSTTGSGGAGGLGDILGLAGLLPKDGIMSALGLSGSGGWMAGANSFLFGSQGVSPATASLFGDATGIGALPSAGTPGLFGNFGMSGGAPIGLAGIAGAAGLGFGAGSLVGSLIAKSPAQQTNSTIGAGLGTGVGIAAGLALDLAFPGLGTLVSVLGGLAGGGLGGLIGPKESVKGYGYRLEAADDGLLKMGASFYNETGAQAFAEAVQGIDALNAWMGQRGITVGGASIIGGNKDGGDYSNATAVSFGEGASQLYYHSNDAQLQNAMAGMGNQFDSLEAMQQFVEGFFQVKEAFEALTAEPIPTFTAQMDALNEQYDAALENVRLYGFSEATLEDARRKAIQAMEDQRIETLRQVDASLEYRRLMADERTQEAELLKQAEDARLELSAFEDQLFELGLTAAETARRMIELEEVQAKERAAIIRRYAEQANQELERAIESILDAGGSIREYIDQLLSTDQGGLSVTDQFANAQQIFNRDLALAQINDLDALNRITQSADNLLEAGKGMYASSPQFQAIRDGIIESLTNLPSVKSYDQRIAEGIELANQLLEYQNILTNGIWESVGLDGGAAMLAVVMNSIKSVLESIHASMYTIGSVTNDLIFGNTKAQYEIGKITNELIFDVIKTSSEIGNVTNTLIFGQTQSLYTLMGAINTTLMTSAENSFFIGQATNTILTSLNTSIVATGNSTNTILSSINTAIVDIGNATNKSLVDGFNASTTVGGFVFNALNVGHINDINLFNSLNSNITASLGAMNQILVDGFTASVNIGGYIFDALNVGNTNTVALFNSLNTNLTAALSALTGSTSSSDTAVLGAKIDLLRLSTEGIRVGGLDALKSNQTIQSAKIDLLRLSTEGIRVGGIDILKTNQAVQSVLLNRIESSIVAVGNATNTILASTNTSIVQIGEATHRILVDGFNASNDINGFIFSALNVGNTNTVALFNSMNTNLTAALGAMNQILVDASAAATTSSAFTNTLLVDTLAATRSGVAHNLVTAGQIQVVANRTNATVLHIATHQQYTLQGNARLVDINTSLGTIHAAIRDVNTSLGTIHATLATAGGPTGVNSLAISNNSTWLDALTAVVKLNNTAVSNNSTWLDALTAVVKLNNTAVSNNSTWLDANTFATKDVNTSLGTVDATLRDINMSLGTVNASLRSYSSGNVDVNNSIALLNRYMAAAAWNTMLTAGNGGLAVTPDPNAPLSGLRYDGTTLIPYANGGLPEYANSPTLAPLALFGEAGEEAIVPLRRMSNGKLGVASSSDDSGLKGEFSQYRRQSAAETRAIVEELKSVKGSVEELNTNMRRMGKRE